jgi:integrase
MAAKRGPLPGVIESHGRYFRIVCVGSAKKWVPLSRVDEGRPALLRAMAELEDRPPPAADSIPELIKSWERDELLRLTSAQSQRMARLYNARIGHQLADFDAAGVTVPAVVDMLSHYRHQPRTYNAMRGQLRELMRYAELRGWRPPGSNPTQAVRTMALPARHRYITDSELRRIKLGAWWGAGRVATQSGPMMCGLIDLLYLTGQAIGDVLRLDESDVAGSLLLFRRAKVAHSTGAAVRIRVSPALRDAIDRLLAHKHGVIERIRRRTGAEPISPALIITRDGQRAGQSGISSAWDRACERAGVLDAHIHDIKAKAITDTERRLGMRAARVQAQHSTEQQTASYVRSRAAEIIKPTR